jgi:hypothetical protein
MARVTVVRSGGFAGMTRAWQAEVSDELVQACPWGAPAGPGGGADRFTYEISVTNGPLMTLSEATLSGPWAGLVEHVLTWGDAVDVDPGPA